MDPLKMINKKKNSRNYRSLWKFKWLGEMIKVNVCYCSNNYNLKCYF